MRSTLIASIPALVVFFGLAFGFVTLVILNIIAIRKENTQLMRAIVITQSGVEMRGVTH